ncbi:MAG: VPLPA-CTERM sorting domain-containing protein [Oricola sp.]|nr:VPLPA-CTERM sorting domain-containing protein [Oricola sp.]
MKSKSIALAAVLAAGAAFGSANAAPCTVGSCDVTDGPLSLSNPVAIQDDDVQPGDYYAEGSFNVDSGVNGADIFADIAFDEILPGQSEVAAGFSDLTIEFFQEGSSLGSYLVTNSNGTTEGGPALQSFMIALISSAAVEFQIEGLAFLNTGAALPDFNFNIRANPVPIPAALPLFFAGLGGLGFAARRKRAQAAA